MIIFTLEAVLGLFSVDNIMAIAIIIGKRQTSYFNTFFPCRFTYLQLSTMSYAMQTLHRYI